jgi:uncharacterized pyridoxal phosphate-dependent enzyme
MSFHESLGLRADIVNAAGTLTALGGSLMDQEVLQAMREAAAGWVDMRELHEAAGRRIASLAGAEAAHVCSCAAAGITLMAAACMTGSDAEKIARLPDAAGMRSRFAVQKAHRSPFDRALRMAGGRFAETGADGGDLAAALDGETAGVFVTSAWFCDGPALSLEETCRIAHARGVPVLVDAAAEVPPAENLHAFLDAGADLVVFSGGKAIGGPQASGFILGRADLVAACAQNDCPNPSVGRGMKAGKEEIAGLLKALELYVARDHAADRRAWEERVALMTSRLSAVPGVLALRGMPFGVGQRIPHAAVSWDEDRMGIGLAEAAEAMWRGAPRIAVQLHARGGGEYNKTAGPQLRLHPHTLRPGEEGTVADRLAALLSRGGGVR